MTPISHMNHSTLELQLIQLCWNLRCENHRLRSALTEVLRVEAEAALSADAIGFNDALDEVTDSARALLRLE